VRIGRDEAVLSLQISTSRADRGLAVAGRRVAAIVFLGLLPAVVLAAVLIGLFTSDLGHAPMFDYHGGLWMAGRSILAGHNPYHTADLADRLRSINQGRDIDPRFALPVYPAMALLVWTPLSLLPYTAAAVIFFAILLAALIGSLLALDVRDWRCYGALFLSYPVIYGLVLGNVTPLLMLGAALAWRYRGRSSVAGAAIGLAIAFKLILWPMLVWLLIARRTNAALIAVAAAAGATICAWAAIGFAGLREYPHMLGLLSAIESRAAYSPYGLAVSLGADRRLALSVVAVLGLGLLGAAFVQRADERRVFGLCLLAAIVFSPVVWSHYYVLLYLPIALRSPRLSALWFVPALLWPIADPARTTPQIAVFMIMATVACALIMVERPVGRVPDANPQT
jgi:alpha-1,2-mannosyltransferase